MQKVATILFIMITLSFSAYSATDYLADRHIGYGAECVSCHDTDKPKDGAEVSTKKCMSCHGDYDEVQKLTKKLATNNPHNNHLGEVDCAVCHSGHSESESYCNSCHENLHKMK